MTLTIALIGRPNVGKSTLFNFLIKKRDSLVSDYPRLTRDKKYGCFYFHGIKNIIIDTGGIDGYEKNFIEKKVFKHSFEAIKESDIIFFITDARSGLTFEDEFISKKIRILNKKIFLVINKIEGLNLFNVKLDFYKLGFQNIYTISATNGLFINNLLNATISKSNIIKINKKSIKENIQIAIIGSQNSGKSTLINKFIKNNFLITDKKPGTTRENIYVKYKKNNENFMLVDTAGFIDKKKQNKIINHLIKKKTMQAIYESNIIIFLLDINLIISKHHLSIINFLIKKSKYFVIVINKCDLLNNSKLDQVRNFLNFRLNFIKYIPKYFISSKNFLEINKLFLSVIKYYKLKNKKIKTSKINKILSLAIKQYQHPLVNGYQIKLKYAYILSYTPFVIVIYGNRIKYLFKTYKSYLNNFFHKYLNIKGMPIKILFKENINPYKINL